MPKEELIDKIAGEVMARLRLEEEEAVEAPAEAPSAPPLPEARNLVTEADILEATARGLKVLPILKGAVITPLARDVMREKGITLEVVNPSERTPASAESPASSNPNSNLIALGADHGGYELKETIKQFLTEKRLPVKDFGTSSPEPVDYPDFALQVAESVASGTCYTGIVVDGGAFASAMVANKVPGALAAACWNVFTARFAREHGDANVLTLGGKVIGPALALEMVETWLKTPFASGRHARRVDKIKEIERKYLRTR